LIEGQNIRRQQIEEYYKSNHNEPQSNRKTTLRAVKANCAGRAIWDITQLAEYAKP
jgi:hypothetical protein